MRALFTCLVVVVSAVSGCVVDGPSAFGQECINGDICDGLLCRTSPVDGVQRCLPPREAGEPGETCAAPFVTTSPGTGPVILDQLVYVGGAVDDVKLSCSSSDAPEVVVRFTVADDDGDATTVPPGVRIRLEGVTAGHFALSVRAADCGNELPFGCMAVGDDEILLQALPVGTYELVVEGTAQQAGGAEEPAHVVIERLDCPPNALPFDGDTCIRNVRLAPLRAPRNGHTVDVLADGSIVVVGGDSGAGARADFEVLEPTSGAWAFGSLSLGAPVAHHATVKLADERLLVIGGTQGDAQLIDLSRFRRAQTSTVLERGTSNVPDSRVEAVRVGNRVFAVSSKSFEQSSSITGGTFLKEVECTGETCSSFLFNSIVESMEIFEGSLSLLAVNDSVVVVSGQITNPFFGIVTAPLSITTVSVETYTNRPIEGAIQRSGAALVSPNVQQVLVIGGVLTDGTRSRDVERYDFSTRQIETLPLLPIDVTNPRAVMLGDLVLIVGDESTPLLMNPETGEQLRAPDVLARTGSRLAVAADAVTIIGGAVDGSPVAAVERLELVGRTARAVSLPACFATGLRTSATISGSTEGVSDVFRSARCDQISGGINYGRDELYNFTLTEPGSVRVSNMTDDDSYFGNAHRVVLLRGKCSPGSEALLDHGLGFAYEEVACGNSDPDLPLFVGDLPAGDYTLVFEHAVFVANDDNAAYAGTPFTATVLLGPPLTCPLDAADPADDTPAGATYVAPESLDEPNATGRLCPGDVDILIFDRSRDDTLGLDGVPADSVSFQLAEIDVAASVAARRPVASGVRGEPLADLDDAPAGVYIARLQGSDEQADFISWSASYLRGCERDPGDSFVAELDNAAIPFAERLTPGEDLLLRSCVGNDADTIILDPTDNTGPMSLRVSGEVADTRLEFFTIVDDDFGSPLPFTPVADPRSEFDTFVDLGVLTTPIAVRLTMLDIDGGTRSVDFNALQPGDECSNALPLFTDEATTSGSRTGDMARFSADVDAVVLGDCTGFREPGRDTVFSVELAPGATIDLVATGLDADTDNDGTIDAEGDIAVYVLQDCNGAETSCVAGSDAGARGDAETLSFTNDASEAATFYIVVDSFYGEVYAWQLDWSISAP